MERGLHVDQAWNSGSLCVESMRVVARGLQAVAAAFAAKNLTNVTRVDCYGEWNTAHDQQKAAHPPLSHRGSTNFISRPSEEVSRGGRAAELSIEEMEAELAKRRTSRRIHPENSSHALLIWRTVPTDLATALFVAHICPAADCPQSVHHIVRARRPPHRQRD